MVEVFSLDSKTAELLRDCCGDWLGELRKLFVPAQRLGTVDGFGTLSSGQALRDKFAQKAVGGPDALVDVLASHIAVVEAMQAQFQACIDNALDQESSNVSTLRSIDQPN